MKQIGLTDESSCFKSFKDEDYQRVVQAMVFDQRIELTSQGYFRATNYNYPFALGSRIVFTETPCCHCSLASMCSATDAQAVVNPNRCVYLQQWEMEF